VYPTRSLATFAYNVAVEALRHGGRTGHLILESEPPSAEQVRWITRRVRVRLGLENPPAKVREHPPDVDALRTLFEVTIVGFWSGQVAGQGSDVGRELDVAAARLVKAAHLVFWSRAAGQPTPLQVMESLVARRLDRVFRRGDLTRAVLDDDGDDEFRLARWLVYPEILPTGGGVREAIEQLYADILGTAPRAENSGLPSWASVLGVAPPFTTEQVRKAYRARSKAVHPDLGGRPDEFVRLQAAYEAAQQFCTSKGV
jgi:hypothetical protein